MNGQSSTIEASLRVLLVADEQRSEQVQSALGRAKLSRACEIASTPGQLVAALQQEPWDLVVCVPDLLQLRFGTCLALILEAQLGLPVVVVTDESSGLTAPCTDEDALAEKGVHFCGRAEVARAVRHARRETALRRELEQLREVHARCTEILDHLPDLVYAHDREGRFTYVNRTAERVGHYGPMELIGKNFGEFVAPEDLELARQGRHSELPLDVPTLYRIELLAKDGRRVPAEISSWLVVRDGALAGICGIARLLGAPADPARADAIETGVAAGRLAAQAELRLGLEVIDTRLAEETRRDHNSSTREFLEEIRADVSRVKSLALEALA